MQGIYFTLLFSYTYSIYSWCVTATPMTSTPSELYKQAHFLGMPMALCTRFTSDAELLQEYMIRHTKTQNIDGSSALVLPKSTTTVKLIEMSASERTKYNST